MSKGDAVPEEAKADETDPSLAAAQALQAEEDAKMADETAKEDQGQPISSYVKQDLVK